MNGNGRFGPPRPYYGPPPTRGHYYPSPSRFSYPSLHSPYPPHSPHTPYPSLSPYPSHFSSPRFPSSYYSSQPFSPPGRSPPPAPVTSVLTHTPVSSPPSVPSAASPVSTVSPPCVPSATSSASSSASVSTPLFVPSATSSASVASQPSSSSVLPAPSNADNAKRDAQKDDVVKISSDEDNTDNDEDNMTKDNLPYNFSFGIDKEKKKKQPKRCGKQVLGSLPPKRPKGRPPKSGKKTQKLDEVDNTSASHFTLDRPVAGSSLSLLDERLTLIDIHGGCNKKFATACLESILENVGQSWEDLAGLPKIKDMLEEMVILPMVNPQLFKGLCDPGRGLLLFGPPGTGKTLIGRCIATEARATFFNVTACTFGSKWFGEAEQMVKAMFTCARALQPSVIFIDEVDSLLSTRSDNDGGCTTRVKNEWLSQLDGCATQESDKVLVIGATNHPYKIDEAAKRRFTTRIYVPLPDEEGRKDIVKRMLEIHDLKNKRSCNALSEEDFTRVARHTKGYTGADLKVVCSAAAMEPIRDLKRQKMNLRFAESTDVRKITVEDVITSASRNKPTVAEKDLEIYEKFNSQFGTVL